MQLNNVGTQEIASERLVLRRFILEDNASMRKNWASDREIQKLYSEPTYATEEAAQGFLAKVIKNYDHDHYYRWAVCLKEMPENCIGQIAYFLIDEKNNWGEIEYCVGKEFQNQGYISEAIASILTFGFVDIGLHKVQVCHKDNNLPSQRVIEKNHFTYEGTLRDFFYLDGAYVDRLYYSILRAEWAALTDPKQ